jgi:two-component system capsular synthesis response regulator RcsB
MNIKKVIVADDHDIFTLGLRIGIERDPFFHVIKEANSGEEVLAFLAKNECDLLVCDYMLPGMDGVKVLSQAKKLKPNIKTILLSSLEKFELQTLCEKNKIDAYLFKSEARSKILEIANLVFQNQKFRPIQTTEVNQDNPFLRLTSKELETLRFWMVGKSMEDTGANMKISYKTVETHRANIKKKFPGFNKEEIFGLMREHGLVD